MSKKLNGLLSEMVRDMRMHISAMLIKPPEIYLLNDFILFGTFLFYLWRTCAGNTR